MGRLVVEGVALDEKNIMSGVGVGGDFFFFLCQGAPKSLSMLTAAMKWKDTCSLEGNLWQT